MFVDACGYLHENRWADSMNSAAVLLHNQLGAAVVDHVGYEAGIICSHPISGDRKCLMMYIDGIKHTIHIISYGVSINGTPKSSIWIGFSLINHPAIGVNPFMEPPIRFWVFLPAQVARPYWTSMAFETLRMCHYLKAVASICEFNAVIGPIRSLTSHDLDRKLGRFNRYCGKGH